MGQDYSYMSLHASLHVLHHIPAYIAKENVRDATACLLMTTLALID